MANIRFKSKVDAGPRLVRPRPAVGGPFEVFRSENDGFNAFIHHDAIGVMTSHARNGSPNEVIGLLAGRICHDPNTGPYTLVMVADAARYGEFRSTPGDVELLATGHDNVRSRLEDAHPDREIVGWYHTHPHCEPSFSNVDMREQLSWSDPNHIGIVYSGARVAEPFGVYRGPEATPLRRVRELPSPQRVRTNGTETLPAGKEDPLNLVVPDHSYPPRQDQRALIESEVKGAVLPWASYRKLLIVTLAIMAGICLAQLISFAWFNRRLSVTETALVKLAVEKPATDRTVGPTPVRPSPVVESMPVGSKSPEAVERKTTVDDPELVMPVKALSPETKSHKNQKGKPADLRLTASQRKRNQNKQAENGKPNHPRTQFSSPGERIMPAGTPKPSPLL